MLKAPSCARSLPFIGAILATFGVPLNSIAEQMVTLQSGTVLVGQLTMEGKNLVIVVDGAKLQVPLSDVATVTSTKTDSKKQAQRLLFRGLESQLLFDDNQPALGLFAEAYRLAPDEVSVAFWHAHSLATAGFGKAASEVFQQRRAEIALAYPAMADRLAAQIERRITLEKLPAALIKRIDQFEASPSLVSSSNDGNDSYAAYFQLVDQNNKPIATSDFRVQCNGQNESLESFPEGYHLSTFGLHRSSQSQPCRVEVVQIGLASESFEFQGTRNGVGNAGVFTVNRFTEEDRRKVDVHVVDSQGKPLSNAIVTFSPTRANRGHNKTLPSKSDSTGKASSGLLPGHYNCSVTAPGFTRATSMVEVLHKNQDPISMELKIYRQIATTVKVVWRSQSTQSLGGLGNNAEAFSQGETELRAGVQVQNDSNGVMRWLRLIQTGDQMNLSFFGQPIRRTRDSGTDTSWIGLLTDTNKASEDAATSTESIFEAIDLKDLVELKDQVKRVRSNQEGRQASVVVPVEEGAIYVGSIFTLSPQTGRPVVVEFKLQVVEVTDPNNIE